MTPKEYVSWFYKKFKNCYAEKDVRTGYPDGLSVDRMTYNVQVIELIEKYDIKSCLEIGTWEGMNGLLFWLHPNIEKFIAIDICKDMAVEYGVSHHPQSDKDFIGHYLKDTKVKVDFIDSMKWDVNEWKKSNGNFDLVYIDGNHGYEYVKNDTEKAMKLNPKIIVWHDYPNEEGVKRYIDEIKGDKDIKSFATHGGGGAVWMEVKMKNG